MAAILKTIRTIFPRLKTGSISNYSISAKTSSRQGDLEGTVQRTPSGNDFASFKGIPYAAPPIGDLKFKPPQSHPGWTGVFDASKHGAIYPQYDKTRGKYVDGSEDCLFLNVYSPDLQGKPKPVILFLHGGDYMSGSGNSPPYGPDYFIDESVVFVTMNYRLEVLGFASLDDEEIPGNAALKDQVMALRWIKENILKFGGDPGNVTLFGHSAGANMASLHMVSPMSKGLFHKLILQGGSFMVDSGMQKNHVNRTRRLPTCINEEYKNDRQLISLLKSTPAVAFRTAGMRNSTKHQVFQGGPVHWGAVVEKTFDDQPCFLPKHPTECLKEREFHDVPILTGYNNADGLVNALNMMIPEMTDATNLNLRFRVPYEIDWNVDEELAIYIAEQIKQFYFGNKGVCEETLNRLVDLETDCMTKLGVDRFAQQMAVLSDLPKFFYRFSYDGNHNNTKKLNHFANPMGACHGDELGYQFKTNVIIDPDTADYDVMKKVVRMWSNFAKQGNPTPDHDSTLPVKWNPITPNTMNYLDISSELTTGVNPDGERSDFWKKIYEQAGQEFIFDNWPEMLEAYRYS